MKSIFKSKEVLLFIITAATPAAFATWMSLLNNFSVEIAQFSGKEIGILQSLREIPGFLAFSVVFVLLFIRQQNLAYISLILLGLGTLLTGFFPSVYGLYITTIIMSIGFHYLETTQNSLTLQWIKKENAPEFLGKLLSVKSISQLIVFIVIYFLMKYLNLEYQTVFFIGGFISLAVGIFIWISFEHFKDDVVQEKKIVLKKEYWLFYLLTFFAGARRQIFIVFAGFLLVEKFGYDVENMVFLLFVNSLLNIYLAPKIGKLIGRIGEKKALIFEYLGLMIVFSSYAFANNLYFVLILYVVDHLLFAMAIALKTYFQKIADPKDIAATSGISFTINHIAAVFLPFLLGLIWISSSSVVFLIGAFIAFLSLISSFLIPNNPTAGYETILKK